MSHNGTERRVTALTDEQLRLISEQTRRATEKSLRKYARSSAVGFVILLSGLGFVMWDDRQGDERAMQEAILDSCRSDRTNAEALRSALDGQIRFVQRANEPPPPTVEERVASIKRLKAQIIVPNCEKRVEEALAARH